jgi:hypothetical protein
MQFKKEGLMNNGMFKFLCLLTLSMTSIIVSADENYTPNPFTPAPKAESVQNVVPDSLNRAAENEANFGTNVRNRIGQGVGNVGNISNVTQALTEREVRSQKILEKVNGKMAVANNIPVENSRFVGVLNGKRVYQNLETNEYVKIEIEK